MSIDSGIAFPFFHEGKIAGVSFILEKLIADTATFLACVSNQTQQEGFYFLNLIRLCGYSCYDFHCIICHESPLINDPYTGIAGSLKRRQYLTPIGTVVYFSAAAFSAERIATALKSSGIAIVFDIFTTKTGIRPPGFVSNV